MGIERSASRKKRDNKIASRRRNETAWAGPVEVRKVGDPQPDRPPPPPVSSTNARYRRVTGQLSPGNKSEVYNGVGGEHAPTPRVAPGGPAFPAHRAQQTP